MKLVFGLGNPGGQYDRTRHNVGFAVVDRLLLRHAPGAVAKARFQSAAYECEFGGERCLLLKPTTYMNRSGHAVGEAVRFFKIEPRAALLVVTDDLYLPCGTIRLRPSGGSGGHNGLADIQRVLGSDEYPRLRVGIDPVPAFMDQSDYVLGRFTDEQRVLVEPALDRASQAVEAFVTRGLDAAMNSFNRDPDAPRPARRPRPEPGTSPGEGGASDQSGA